MFVLSLCVNMLCGRYEFQAVDFAVEETRALCEIWWVQTRMFWGRKSKVCPIRPAFIVYACAPWACMAACSDRLCLLLRHANHTPKFAPKNRYYQKVEKESTFSRNHPVRSPRNCGLSGFALGPTYA